MSPDISIKINSDISYIPYVLAITNSYSETIGFDENICKKITIAVEEVLTNIIKHSYKFQKDKIIVIEFGFADDKIIIKVKHKGAGFKIKDYECQKIEQIKKERKKGGFGIFLIKKFMDDIIAGEEKGWKYYLMKKSLKR